jgi:hypothetical protein
VEGLSKEEVEVLLGEGLDVKGLPHLPEFLLKW